MTQLKQAGMWLATRLLPAVLALFIVVGITEAATTISTNIATDGNLSVTGTASTTGQATFSGNVWFGGFATTTAADGRFSTKGALIVSASTSLQQASTTDLSTSGALWVGGNATTTSAGVMSVQELTDGGGQCTITDADGGAYSLTQAELAGCNYLYMTASGAGQEVIQLTFPASSTFTTLIPNVGDHRQWLIDASDLAAATTTTITAAAGFDLIAVTTADDVIDGAEYAELNCWRKSDTDIACVNSELINSD